MEEGVQVVAVVEEEVVDGEKNNSDYFKKGRHPRFPIRIYVANFHM